MSINQGARVWPACPLIQLLSHTLHCHRTPLPSSLHLKSHHPHRHHQVVKWLFENRQEGCTPAAAEGAAGQGHDEIVQYLKGHKRGRSVDYKDLGEVLAQGKS